MAKRRIVNNGGSVFNWGTVVNVAMIPLLTVAFYFVVSWATTGDTLKQHEKAIAEEAAERKAMKIEDDVKREALRKALTDNSNETRSAISDLSKTVAVQANEIINIDKHLEMLVSGVQRLEQSVRPPDPHGR